MGGVNGHTAQPFAQTSAAKLGRRRDIKDMLATGKVTLDEAKATRRARSRLRRPCRRPRLRAADRARRTNPLDPEAPKPETRVVVVGDSDFAANAGLGIQGNRDLFMNTIGWLSQQENLIAIRPKNPEDRRITLTATQQSNLTLALAARHSRLHFRHRRLRLVAESAECAACDPRLRCSSF